MTDPATYTIEELARMLRISKRQVYRLIDQNEIPGLLRVGRLVRFRRAIIDKWLGQRSAT